MGVVLLCRMKHDDVNAMIVALGHQRCNAPGVVFLCGTIGCFYKADCDLNNLTQSESEVAFSHPECCNGKDRNNELHSCVPNHILLLISLNAVELLRDALVSTG